MYRRIQEFAHKRPWMWALLWGLIVVGGATAINGGWDWWALVGGTIIFVGVGVVRSRQWQRRGDWM